MRVLFPRNKKREWKKEKKRQVSEGKYRLVAARNLGDKAERDRTPDQRFELSAALTTELPVRCLNDAVPRCLFISKLGVRSSEELRNVPSKPRHCGTVPWMVTFLFFPRNFVTKRQKKKLRIRKSCCTHNRKILDKNANRNCEFATNKQNSFNQRLVQDW